MIWREYHEQTKHSRESLRRNRHFLDWASMPDPFRHYDGAPVIDLPASPPAPETLRAARDGTEFLSSLLFHSAAISAAKLVPSTGYRYALRVNPSSGNLHPTEFHFITRGVARWPDGLYHYRPSSHMAEQRATGSFLAEGIEAPVVFLLTSIAWREAWKYQSRAYRYCCHDIGHARESLAMAAREMGCGVRVEAAFEDDGIASGLRLHTDEWPMLLIALTGGAIPLEPREPAGPAAWTPGEANELSPIRVAYPWIDRVHEAARAPRTQLSPAPVSASEGIALPEPARCERPFAESVRGRRSALDFIGGSRPISFAQLSALLASTTLGEHGRLELYLYAHRVTGLDPGVYRFTPGSRQLAFVKAGDQQVMAAALSLGQQLAGNCCVAFSMIARLGPSDRDYRIAHFDAGATGQRLYVTAERLGLRATGIGAFFDDEVHRYLDISPGGDRQVIYHFAIGYPVHDPRLEA